MAESATKDTDTEKKSTTAKKVGKPPKAPVSKKTTKKSNKTTVKSTNGGGSATPAKSNGGAKAAEGNGGAAPAKSNGAATSVAKTATNGAAKPPANSPEVQKNNADRTGNKRGTRKRGGRLLREKREQQPLKSRTFPIVRQTLQLDHSIAQGAYDQFFDGFRSAFFHCTGILGRCGIPGGADQVNNYIMDLIDNARTEMENETARISRLISEETGNANVPRSAPQIQQRTAEVPSFLVRKYLTLFPAADRLIDAIVYAEIVGVVNWQRRLELLNLVKKYLRSPWGRYHSIAQKLLSRQQHHHKNVAEARKEVQKVLEATLLLHKALPRVEQKRPMKQQKMGATG